MRDTIYFNISIFIFLLILSGLFSASETALLSIKREELSQSEKSKSLRCKFKNMNNILSTILVSNNMVNSYLTSLATSVMLSYFGARHAVLYSTIIVTGFILIFGEITPKLIAKNYSTKVSLLIIRPLHALSILLYPLIVVITFISKIIGRMFGFRIVDKDIATITEKDIRSLISFGNEEGIIEAEKREMLDGVLDFSDLTVEDLAVPRQNMYMLKAEDILSDVIDEIIDKGFSRIPVYRENFDDIVGVVYVKDIITTLKKGDLTLSVDKVMRDIIFVPETKSAFSLLKHFKAKKVHIAIVVDEYGGTAGLITIEDILEQIVGKIEDEFDKPEEVEIKEIDKDKYLIKGSVDIEDINKETGLDIPESDEYDSLGGFISFITGVVPEKGELVQYRNLEILVKETEQHAVKYAVVVKKDDLEEELEEI